MLSDQRVLGVCFFHLDSAGSKFFGFSEFLAGLALMVLAWTIGDVRYRFRVQTAPIPLREVTFSVVAAVGVLTLLTDLWRSEQWLVPCGDFITPAIWQAILAGLFLFTFLTWAWFAFIRPPVYGKKNSKRFAQSLYGFILKGSPEELGVIADELAHSSKNLVSYATAKNSRFRQEKGGKRAARKVEMYANNILMLIADKRFCRVVVQSAPSVALNIFKEMRRARKCVHVEVFSKNILNSAINDKNSFLFHESGAYESGLLGHHKPLSQAMFSNYWIVDTIGSLLDPDITDKRKWDAEQWAAYCRIVLIAFKGYVSNKQWWVLPIDIVSAKEHIERSVGDLYVLNGVASNTWNDDVVSRLHVVTDFIKKAVDILDEQEISSGIKRSNRPTENAEEKNLYDHLAELILEVVFAAAHVTSPAWECWLIQHNYVWSRLFGSFALTSKAGNLVRFKARRLLYEEIIGMSDFSHYRGAKMMGLCLNVMGLAFEKGRYGKSNRPLHTVILRWMKSNYADLHVHNPKLAEVCLVGSVSYDQENHRLVMSYPSEGGRAEPQYRYFEVSPPSKAS